MPPVRPFLRTPTLLPRARSGSASRPVYARLRFDPLEERAVPATFTVTTAADAGAGSLRQAILDANANAGVADDIVFDTAGLFATAQTITLTSGQLTLTDTVTTTITGTGADLLAVSGSNASRVFLVNTGASAALSGLTITGGSGTTGLGGGGLFNDGGTVALTACTISGNAGLGGGGLLAYNGSTTLTDCTVSGNTATVNTGGGLYIRNGTAELTNCTISGNVATTISGGIFSGTAATTLTNCTVSGNTAASDGGLGSGGGTFTLANTVVAGNTAAVGPDASGTFTSLGNNLIGKTNNSSGWVGSDLTGTVAAPLNPQLGPLANNGGPTQTRALLFNSPAINAGNPANAATSDQRGVARFGNTDIGAFEYQFKVTTAADGGPGSLREAIAIANITGGTDAVVFRVGTGAQTIVPTSALPDITEAIVIDGTTQPGFGGSPLIRIDGSGAGDANGLTLDLGSDGSTIRGLIVSNFNQPGRSAIRLVSDSHVVQGNWIGTTAAGTAAAANRTGITVLTPGNLIGSDGDGVNDPVERNVIGGNTGDGILVTGPAAGGNTIAGNLIGTDARSSPAGAVAWWRAEGDVNDFYGSNGATINGIVPFVPGKVGQAFQFDGSTSNYVQVANAASLEPAGAVTVEAWVNSPTSPGPLNYILSKGGDASSASYAIYTGASSGGLQFYVRTGAGTFISADAGTGVWDGTWHHVAGVYDGTGVKLYVDGVQVGGTVPANGSITYGLTPNNDLFVGHFRGTFDLSFTGTVDEPTVYGTALTAAQVQTIAGMGAAGKAGFTALPNQGAGVVVRGAAAGNTIGGGAAGARNVISGNATTGVTISGPGVAGNVVVGNYIGTDASGTADVGNLVGVQVSDQSSNTTVGGPGAAGNVIAGNDSMGVQVDSGATAVTIQGNRIGVDATGTGGLAQNSGIFINSGAQDILIGGTAAGAGNVIGANNSGIFLDNAGAAVSDVTIQGNRIGTNAAGNAAVPNLFGIDIVTTTALPTQTVSGVLIGGTAAGAGNQISGNLSDGVRLSGPRTTGITLQGNRIGTNAAGTAALPNLGAGVRVEQGATNSTIGGGATGARNVISGNDGDGVSIQDAGTANNRVQGNYVGLTADGTTALGNAQGIALNAAGTGNVIGVDGDGVNDAGEGNVVSGNTAAGGIGLTQTNSVVIAGNYVGLNAAGTAAVPNTDVGAGHGGVSVGTSLLVRVGTNADGVSDDLERNVLAGNAGYNLVLSGTQSVVAGNYVGLNAAGTASMSPTDSGIVLFTSTGNRIGTNADGVRDAVERNVVTGVLLNVSSTGNTIAGNYIGTNAAGTAKVAAAGGVYLAGPSTGNLVGGPTEAARNVIAGSNGDGVRVDAGPNTVQGNYVGLTAAGTGPIPNAGGGVVLVGGGITVRGNVIAASIHGVRIDGVAAIGNVVAGNRIGTDPTGTVAIGNTGSGVVLRLGAIGNTIGGTTAADRNVISGNTNNGVDIQDAGTIGNVIAGNYIGTTAAGTAALGNAQSGVRIRLGANGNKIGGTTAADRNVISGNAGNGIDVDDTGTDGNVIVGNYIGTTATGTAALGNRNGVNVLGGTGTVIGGTTAGFRNVISGNDDRGIILHAGTSANIVQGNYVGTDATGTLPLGNGIGGGPDFAGIRVAGPGNTIGGTAPEAGNVIAANGSAGVHLVTPTSTGNTVQGNWIGTNQGGAGGLGNGHTGVTIQNGASGNLIGGPVPGAGNTITGNNFDGVRVNDDTSVGNAIRGNSIFANGGLGIDLNDDGVTPNGPSTTGPNNLAHFPEVTGGAVGTTTRAQGTLTAAPLTTYAVDLFASDRADPSGFGEGQVYLGSVNVTTNAAGVGTFDVGFAAATGADQVLTATATDPAGNTSEFALARRPNATPSFGAADLALSAAVSPTVNVTRTTTKDFTSVSLLGTFVDGNPFNTYQATITWGDGRTTTVVLDQTSIGAGGLRTFAATHDYPAGADATFTPVVRLTLLQTVEAAPVTLTGVFVDPDLTADHTVSIDWGDGSPLTTVPVGAPDPASGLYSFSATHAFADDAAVPTRVTVTVADSGATATSAIDVIVRNRAPTATLGAVGTLTEGTPGTVAFTGPVDAAADLAAGLTYGFDLDNDGHYELTGGSPSATVPADLLPNGPGSLAVRGRVADKDGGIAEFFATIPVVNAPPTVVVATDRPGYLENDVVTLTGTITDPGRSDAETVEITWNDGSPMTVLHLREGVRTFTVTHRYLNNPTGPISPTSPFPVAVKVTDTDLGVGTTTANVPVANVAPTAIIRGATATSAGVISLTAGGGDRSPVDEALLTYVWTVQEFVNGAFQPFGSPASGRDFSFTRPTTGGVFRITLMVSDPEGATATDTALVVGGTAAANTIDVLPVAGSGDVQVVLDSTTLGRFAPGNRVMVFSGANPDVVRVDPALTVPTELDGEEGNDSLSGGSGPDFVSGGLGDDSILGGEGNDVVDGGDGNDTAGGGNGDDVYPLVPGSDNVVSESGTGGTDTIDYTQANSGIEFSIDTDAEGDLQVVDGTNGVTFYGQFENLTGSTYGDKLTGNDLSNVIFGGDTSGGGTGDTLTSGGGNDTVVGGSGNDIIFGGDPATGDGGNNSLVGGTGNDSVVGGTGNDVIFGGDPLDPTGGGNDTVGGGAGDDTVTAGTGNNTISGGAGNDVIFGGDTQDTATPVGTDSIEGGAGNDSIVGGAGNDIIFGGDPTGTTPGSDTIAGGAGNDSIIGSAGNDVIFGGDRTDTQAPGDDTIKGGEGNDSLIGSKGNDVIFGGDPAGPTTGSDTITGGAGSDSLIGSAGNDVIFGGDRTDPTATGDDTIKGGAGNDSLIGSKGNDVIFGGDPLDPGNDTVDGGAGNDTVHAGAGGSTISGGAGNDVIFGGDRTGVPDKEGDSLVGGSGNDSLIGSKGNDVIFGGDRTDPDATGDDTIKGGEGSDSLIGSKGNDVIFGGDPADPTAPGDDTITGGAGNDTITGSAGNDIIFGGDRTGDPTKSGTDSLIGGRGNDTVVGGSGNDVIFGGDPLVPDLPGNDTLDGGAGDDTITGGAGNDTMVGGAGNDIIFGGTKPAPDPLAPSTRDSVVGGSGNDTVVGGSGNDVIFGGDPLDPAAPGDDSLSGGAGNDSVIGGKGNDVIFGGDRSNPDAGGSDTIKGGEGNDSLIGSKGNDVIFGGDRADGTTPGSDTIKGGGGNDSLIGSKGNDVIFGGDPADPAAPGNDTIIGAEGDDSLVGSRGNDVIFGGDQTNPDRTGSDTIKGGAGNDSLIGSKGNDVIFGGDPADPVGPGRDTISGGDGNDSIVGGTGNDVIFGGDPLGGTLIGGSGDDTLTGGPGNDVIFGDDGTDTVTRAADADLVLNAFSLAAGNAGGQDSLAGIEQAVLIGGPGNNVLDAHLFAGPVTLVGGAGHDTLIGGPADDWLAGGTGNDSMAGGAGNDEYVFDGPAPGADVVDEPAGTGGNRLNFFGLTGPITFNLTPVAGPGGGDNQLAAAAAAPTTQPIPGGSVLLTNPAAVTTVVGSPYADHLTGNGTGVTLIGAGGADTLTGGSGHDLLQAGVTQVVYLNFDAFTDFGDRAYTAADRDAVQARLEADFSAFGFRFTQARPAGGAYTTVYFNRTPYFTAAGVPLAGGISDLMDWRNLGLGGTVSLDVNGFLGYATSQLAPTVDNFVGLSATIAAHELGHIAGLRHGDSFGPIGSGVYLAPVAGAEPPEFTPAYPGPTAATETPLHVMSSPASTRSALIAAAADTFFGEREALKLAFADTGTVSFESALPLVGTARRLDLLDVSVPNTLRAGANAGAFFSAQAANVAGSIVLGPDGRSEEDWYAFTATTGDTISVEVLSRALARIPEGIDSIVLLTDANRIPLAYYTSTVGAVNDDNFENQDSQLIDVPIPADGTYYLVVDTWPNPEERDPAGNLERAEDSDTGEYELFVYRARAVPTEALASASGDRIAAATGDTVIASSGRDAITFDGVSLPQPARVTVTAPAGQSATEGVGGTFALGSFTDLAGNLPWTVAVNWGDQTPATTFTVSATGSLGLQAHTFAQSGAYPVTVKVTNRLGQSATQSFAVTVANVAPVVTAPATQTVAPGIAQTLALGSFADVPVDGPWKVSVNWGDGTTAAGQVTASGPVAGLHTFAVAGTYPVTVTVTDRDGGSHSATFTVQAVAPAPVDVTIDGPATGTEAEAVALSTPAINPATGTQAGLTFRWEASFVPAGSTTSEPVNLVGVPTTGSTFALIPMAAGTYTVALTVTTPLGGTATATHVVTVAAAQGVYLRDDPLRPGQQMIVVGGTAGSDHIVISPGTGAGEIKVQFNGVSSAFAGATRLVVLAHDGNDHVQVAGGISIPAYLDGGAGNDRLKGGNGNNVLIGGAGDDLVVGGAGRDLLIGGFGSDRLVGNDQDDILIAGSTDFDRNAVALDLVQREWGRTDATFASRVGHLDGTLSGSPAGPVHLNDQTVRDDGAADVLTGDAGQDWFVFNQDGSYGAVLDTATDMTSYEALYAEDVDFIYLP